MAERAGVSVGTLYQYYPNKLALLNAVLERHLDGFAQAVEEAARKVHGKPLPTMVEDRPRAYWRSRLHAS